jgi:arsenate reductase (thioredoxin)
MSDVFRVLFLCTGNSARSQIAQALLEHYGAGRFEAESAGTEPAARVNPGAIEALAAAGIRWGGHPPRRVEEVERRGWDLVVTVCDDARESCPVFPPGPIIAHWGMPDPAAVKGDDEARRAAFLDTLAVLRRRMGALVGLPVEDLSRAELEERIRRIGAML